jgi:hypothetical protein
MILCLRAQTDWPSPDRGHAVWALWVCTSDLTTWYNRLPCPDSVGGGDPEPFNNVGMLSALWRSDKVGREGNRLGGFLPLPLSNGVFFLFPFFSLRGSWGAWLFSLCLVV